MEPPLLFNSCWGWSIDIQIRVEWAHHYHHYELIGNGFSLKESASEEVLVDFRCDWSKIIENHLDILHIFLNYFKKH